MSDHQCSWHADGGGGDDVGDYDRDADHDNNNDDAGDYDCMNVL